MDYRRSHLDKGIDYHQRFVRNPRRALLWSIEKKFLFDIVKRFLGGKKIRHLDFACGTGRILTCLQDYVHSATGVDVSESMLEVAKASAHNATLLTGDITRAPLLKGQEFDLITAFRFFANAEDQLREDAFAALVRHLKPGGILVFNNHKPDSALSFLVLRLVRFIKGKETHDRRMSRRDVLRLVQSAGLTIQRTYHVGILPDYESKLLKPRFLVRWIETFASHLPLAPLCEDLIYVCEKPAARGGFRDAGS